MTILRKKQLGLTLISTLIAGAIGELGFARHADVGSIDSYELFTTVEMERLAGSSTTCRSGKTRRRSRDRTPPTFSETRARGWALRLGLCLGAAHPYAVQASGPCSPSIEDPRARGRSAVLGSEGGEGGAASRTLCAGG